VASTSPESILDPLGPSPPLGKLIGALRELDAAAEADPEAFAPRRLHFARNFTIEPIEPLLKAAGYRAGLAISASYSEYEPIGATAAEGADAVVVAMRLEELSPALTRDFATAGADAAADLADAALERVVGLALANREATGAPVFVLNFAAPELAAAGLADAQSPGGQVNTIRALNVRLAAELSTIDGAYVIDADELFARDGRSATIDARGLRMSGAPYSRVALEALAAAITRHLGALGGAAVKCIVLDCDDTLWGGVVGEVGRDGIALAATGGGRRFQDFQRELLDLKARGVLLAISSKNEPEDVSAVLRDHPDCLIREPDLAAIRVSWEGKDEAIVSIAEELNLGLEHLLLIDDNPVEREWVSQQLPEVRVIDAPPQGPDGTRLDDLGLFDSLSLTSEDRRRTEMYRAERERKQVRRTAATREEYLRSLEMVATVGVAGDPDVPRVSQLTQRTNQFNLTTVRRDQEQIRALLADDGAAVIWLSLEDRFGASGVVGCGIVVLGPEGIARIDTLLLSCRVIGRGLEAILVNRLGRLAREMGAGSLLGEYVPTARNGQVAELYPQLGFEPAGEGAWSWDLAAGDPPAPDWLEVRDA